MRRPRSRSRALTRGLHLAAVLALVLSTLLGSVLQADPAVAKDRYRGRKDGRPAATQDRDAHDGRIVNGAPADQGEYPFAVFIESPMTGNPSISEKCTGSLVARDWVLTAAHCFKPGYDRPVVIAGSVDITDQASRIVRTASAVHIHPDYDPAAIGDPPDVALVQLSEPLPFGAGGLSAIGIPPASSIDLPAGEPLTAVGWGLTSPGGSISLVLLEAALAAVSDQACADAWGLNPAELAYGMCAGPRTAGGSHICNGDSGGPLFLPEGRVQVGISWIGKCGRDGTPGGFMRVDEPTVHAFITDKVRTTDDTPPSVSITGPRPNATVSSSFQIDATVSDGRSGISIVEFWACADTCTLLGKDMSAPYQWPNATLAPGKSYELLAWAYDNGGNRGESVRVPITTEEGKASGNKPKVSCCTLVEDPDAEGVFLANGQSRLYYRPGSGSAQLVLAVEATVKGGSIASVAFPDILGTPGGAGIPVPGSPLLWGLRYEIPASGTAAGSGPVEAVITATTSGNKSKGASLSVIPDSQAPSVRIKQPKDWFATSGSVTVKLEADDPSPKGSTSSGIARIDLYRVGSDGGATKLGSDDGAPWAFTITPQAGPQSIYAEAIDNVGNRARSETIHVCGGSCGDDPGPSPTPEPTPPPGDSNPDDWRTAEPVSSLPFSKIMDTDDLDVGDDDPTCTDEEGEVEEYESSAWFRVQLSQDADVFVDTSGSSYDDGDGTTRPVLDTVLMVAVINNGRPSPIMCVDDTATSNEAALTFHAHAGMAYYVMAGTYYEEPSIEDPEPEQIGYLLVEMSKR